MTKADYDELVRLRDWGSEWMARDKSGSAWGYVGKPQKYKKIWARNINNPTIATDLIKDGLFRFMRWEDENPVNIAAAIAEYERAQEGK